jgi:hypothetical protein
MDASFREKDRLPVTVGQSADMASGFRPDAYLFGHFADKTPCIVDFALQSDPSFAD